MAKKGYMSFWKILLQISLAALLIIGGISVFIYSGRLESLFKAGDPLIKAVGRLFNGNLRDIVVYVMAVIELIAGILLVLDLFHLKNPMLDKLDDIFILIIMIAWIVVFVVLGDIIPLFKGDLKFLPFLIALAKDAIMVGVMGIVKREV